mgnify:CR=1 FL=1
MKQKILDLIQQEITEDNKNNDFYPLTTQKVEWLNDFKKKVEAINYTHSCKSDSDQFSFADMRDAFDYASVSSQRRDGYTFKEWISKR